MFEVKDINNITDEELTAIYNQANKLDPKRHNSITTERIFNAMKAMLEVKQHADS